MFGESLFDRRQIVKGQSKRPVGDLLRYPGRTGQAEGGQARSSLDQQSVRVPVITALKLDHIFSTGKRPRHADGGHRRFGARADEAQFFDGGHGGDHQLRQVGFGGGRGSEACAPFRGPLNRLHHQRVGMAQDHGPPGTEVVQIAIAIGVPQVGSLGSHQEGRISPYRAKGAHRRIDASGQVALCAPLQLSGSTQFSVQKQSPSAPV